LLINIDATLENAPVEVHNEEQNKPIERKESVKAIAAIKRQDSAKPIRKESSKKIEIPKKEEPKSKQEEPKSGSAKEWLTVSSLPTLPLRARFINLSPY
jgi:hypothetical protein